MLFKSSNSRIRTDEPHLKGSQSNYASRHAYSSRALWDIVNYHGVGSDASMVAYGDRPQNLSSRTDVYMAAYSGYATVVRPNGHLLEE